jgi:RHH-type transcriptional regulator, proline utilization regulon repressor / proline dehydrogenase / delta 1-pyrroline-5-carboxylate dehydrogenase
VAALVTGNPVLLKPAEQTPRIARTLVEILQDCGVPRDVLQLVCGPGETIGAALVRDPRVALIAFTGSRAVGLEILEAAGRTPEGQPHVKRVICEMGGKNAIIVDDTADLDEAVLGVRASAFGYQGQKCSACARVIVLDAVYDVFLERLLGATQVLALDDPADPGTDLGPLIDAAAARQVREYIELGKREGRLELAVPVPDGLEARVGRPFVGPHVFSGIERQHRLANEEIFGPVLAVMRAASFDAALQEANATVYRLTGGVYSRRPSRLEQARREFLVGNLYLNRAITGARVGRQPFGGFGLSGVGSQAGGAEYLLQFVHSRAIAENTLRRGFSP